VRVAVVVMDVGIKDLFPILCVDGFRTRSAGEVVSIFSIFSC
jgi:hypothetical protein